MSTGVGEIRTCLLELAPPARERKGTTITYFSFHTCLSFPPRVVRRGSSHDANISMQGAWVASERASDSATLRVICSRQHRCFAATTDINHSEASCPVHHKSTRTRKAAHVGKIICMFDENLKNCPEETPVYVTPQQSSSDASCIAPPHQSS